MNLPLWFSNLLFWSAQVAVLALAAALLPRLLQLRQPRVLLAYWRALLAVALLLPAIQPWHPAPTFSAFLIAPAVANVHVATTPSPVASHWHFPSGELVAQMVAVVILAGIAVRFAILLLGLLRLRQFRQSSSSVSLPAESTAVLEEMRARVNARADFRLSADIISPVTFGFAAPVILLPAHFPAMDARFQSAIACHELLHVRRRDWAHHLLEEIIRAIFWFHPAIAWLIARVRLAREQVVDLEVVRLTDARKTYLEALLAFTVGRSPAAPIPAPPFLVERQLAERVALMLKEVRMSRTRLIASLTAISCCIALTIILAVSTFPLKAAPRSPQSPPQGGLAQRVSGGVVGGVTGGISGGVTGGVAGGISEGIASGTGASRDIPTVENNTIWTDTVKRGPMVRQVRGLGTLVRAKDFTIAKVLLPESMTREVHANQNAVTSTKKGPLATGHVISVSREVVNGTVAVDISLEAVPTSSDKIVNLDPHFVGVPDQIDATIDIEKLDNVLYVGRPVHAGQSPTRNSSFALFKIVKDGTEAERVNVKFGRASVNTIEILDGLKEGDKIILSDMSTYDNADRIHLK
jgi:beta-lactamase regulating signal transducer with metallopeptidase domain